jgi:ADP-ribosylarginine hydrolase
MIEIKEKIEASLMLSSYFETVGFKNGNWEFNYHISHLYSLSNYISIWNTLLHHYLILGGSSHINVTNWLASDDTILIIATAEAVLNGGGEENYIKQYIESYDLLGEIKRCSGINTIDTLQLLKKGLVLKTLPIKSTMGGNGAAMRTGPIGLFWYNNIEKVIEESIIASRLTHNYYLGFLGGMVTALFTSFAMNNIPPYKWASELIELYNNKIIHKYYPKEHTIGDLDIYINNWKRYQETRINKLKYKNNFDNFIFAEDRVVYLFSFYPDEKIQEWIRKGNSLRNYEKSWDRIGGSGLDCCIYAYDCLLMSMLSPATPTVQKLDLNNIIYSFETFMTLVSIHPGDNDTTAAIGGGWFGALNGYGEFNKERIKELEFYNELKTISDNF